MRVTRRGAASAVAAALGIVSAAVLAWSVSRLVAERIGLSSAPPSVVQGLVPRPPARGSQLPLPPRTEDASGGGTARLPSASPAPAPGTASAAGGSAAPAPGAGAPARSGDRGDSGGSDGGGGGRDD